MQSQCFVTSSFTIEMETTEYGKVKFLLKLFLLTFFTMWNCCSTTIVELLQHVEHVERVLYTVHCL